jgi:tetratricopeptide (TPR) repeat protein
MYLPMIGISMIFGYVIVKVLKIVNPKIIYTFVIILFSMYALISYQRGKVYNNQYALYKDAVSKNSQNVRTAYNMAVAYVANKEFNNAIKQFDDVIKINPIYRRDQVWLLTAISYESLGQKDLAKKYYYKAFLLNYKDSNIFKQFEESFNDISQAKQYLILNTVRLDKEALAQLDKDD